MYHYDFEPWLAEMRVDLNNRFAGRAITAHLVSGIHSYIEGKIRDLRQMSHEADYWIIGMETYWVAKDSLAYKLVLKDGYEASKPDTSRTGER